MTARAVAARLIEHRKPLEVASVELPHPADDEVLVDLSYAALNPVDRYGIDGLVAADGPLPRTVGGEAAGHLDGAPVLVFGAGLGAVRDGLFATAAVVPREAIYELPDGVPLDEAAALGVVGLTAWQLVETACVGDDDRVLVLGAAGGVGQSVVSYASSTGATVLGQTTSSEKAAAITEFGAKDAVVTDAAGLTDAVRDFAPSVVIDPLGGEFTPAALAAVVPRGRVILFGASAGAHASIDLRALYRREIQLLTYAGLLATQEERRARMPYVIEEFAAGRLRIRVGARMPLDAVNVAFNKLADHAVVGKVVLELR